MERTFEKITTSEVTPFVLKKRKVLEGFAAVWTTVKMLLLVAVACYVTNGSQAIIRTFPIPMKLEVPVVKVKETPVPIVKKEPLKVALKHLGCPTRRLEDVYYGIKFGAQRINVDPLLILALLFTESRFDPRAVSPLGYKGYMQTKHASMEFGDVDILYGCRKLQEKMKLAKARKNGKVDMERALALYKGGLNPMAFNQAREVLTRYNRLKSLT